MFKKIRKFNKSLVWFSVLFCVGLVMLPSIAKAAGASLYLSPSAAEYIVGSTFLIQVKVNTGEVAANAVDGTMIFNPDKLEVKSISKTNSILTLWVQEPTFSNSLGTINFAGGKPSPGFSGAAGLLFTITFKAKTVALVPNLANVMFAAGSVLADDGKGTNILASMGQGSYSLSAREVTPLPLPDEEEYVLPAEISKAPARPVVNSPTHPDETKWYSNNDPEFTWKLPSDVTEVSFLLHQKPDANPGNSSDGLLESKIYEDVEDGVWYFHIKFRNQYGWGAITHRKVLIDTESPNSFGLAVDNEGDNTNPAPILYFRTEDSLSGIDYYEIKIGSWAASTTEAGTKENPYRPFPIAPGEHLVEVKALDKAGNSTLASAEIKISPIEILVEITEIPKRINVGEAFEIKGKTRQETMVRIYIQKDNEEPLIERVKADSTGVFSLFYDKTLNQGDYFVWARAEDERGALSRPTKKYALEVGLPPFLKFGKIALDYITTMITLLILIIGAIAIIFYVWYRISIWKKRVSKETKEVSQSVAGSFRALRGEVEEEISLLDKKPGLTKSEKEIRDKLQEALDISEKFINKEIKDVEKELE